MTVSRHCSSGLNAIATAAGRIIVDGEDVVVGAGVESISLSMAGGNFSHQVDKELVEQYPGLWMPMIETADIVADRYKVSREYQDEYSLESQKRTAAAQGAGLFDDEIVPMDTRMIVKDKATGETSEVDYTVTGDECNRPSTTLGRPSETCADPGRGPIHHRGQRVPALRRRGIGGDDGGRRGEAPRRQSPGRVSRIHGGGLQARRDGHRPGGRGSATLERAGLTVDDIDLWELNEAFASQCLYCRDTLGIDPAKYNVNGGSISIGHPFGMTGARCVGHLLREGQRRKAKWGVVTMCIGGGQGAAGLFEIF